jgi:radial spoke head protein 9
VENQPPAEEEEANEKDSVASMEEEKVPARAFTELDKLAVVVRAIEQDCQLVPQISFRITPAHELSKNRAFAGLSRTDVKSLHYYLHFRNVQSKEKRLQLDRDDAIFTYDFLDPAEDDLPKPCWSVQIDNAKALVNVRSLLWPGYVAYHRACTARYGGIYIGNGIESVDLAFLL